MSARLRGVGRIYQQTFTRTRIKRLRRSKSCAVTSTSGLRSTTNSARTRDAGAMEKHRCKRFSTPYQSRRRSGNQPKRRLTDRQIESWLLHALCLRAFVPSCLRVFVPSCLRVFVVPVLRGSCCSCLRSYVSSWSQSEGCAASRFVHLYAAMEFFQKYFSATVCGFDAKYSFAILKT